MESYLDSSHQVNVPSSAHSRMAGGLTKSSASSGIFFQGDGQSQILVNSHLYPSYGNSSNSERPNMCMISEETYKPMLNNISNSGPSVGASSLVTDANSAFSGGPQLQRSASINTESYMRLPASPMSFSSNNISISGSSVVDGSTMVQKNSKHDTGVQQQQGASGATSLHTLQANQVPFPMGSRLPGSFIQDSNNISHVQKKPRLDVKQDDILQQQVLQQVFQRQDPMQLRGQNPQMQFLLQQQRLRQQQQILQSMPPLQRLQLQQQQQQQHQQLQLRQQLQQQFSGVKRPHETGVCARRLMQYLYHQRQRPHDNSIVYWRKFVSEYYSTRAKKRWCLSLYDNVGQQALGVFPQAAADAWHCDICGSKSGRGFEASFEVLPRLNEIKFGSGVIDELLFLDMPRECRLPSGIMILEYGKAVQESVYEQLRVVREGHLRIIFSQDLKILSWEFCARRHEELLPRRSVAPQVNQLLQVAQKCQSTISESGSDGVPQQDLQTNSNMVLTAGRQLAKSLELQSLNDLGFSKRYVRCLQISEVVNSMKDLIEFCRDHKSGPIEGLKSYPRHSNASKLQMQRMQELEQLASAQGLPTDRNTLNKLMALHSGVNISMSNPCNHTVNHGAQSGSAQTPFASANYQNMLIRQNSITTNQSPSSSTLSPGGFSSPYLPPQHQMQLCSLSTSHQQPLNADQALQQQQMMQQLYQDMSNNSGNGQRQSFPAQNQNILNMGRNPNGFGQNSSAATPTASNVSETAGYRPSPSQNNSLNTASNNDTSSSVADSNNGLNQFQNIASQEGMLPDISHEFTGTEFFNSDLDDNNLGYTWKD